MGSNLLNPPIPKKSRKKVPRFCPVEIEESIWPNGETCGLPKSSMSTKFCDWHWLARQPIEVQIQAADIRHSRVPEERRRMRVPSELWPPGYRWCSGCQAHVPLFYVPGKPDAKASRCKACVSAGQHAYHIAKTYNISRETYLAIFKVQKGHCAGCGCTPRTQRLHTDHNHDTGVVRGLLCSQCNWLLRMAAFHQSDPSVTLRNLLAYLSDTPMEQVTRGELTS